MESPSTTVSDCIPIIAALSLHNAVTKSQNALSSRFLDASNSLWIACSMLSESRSARSGCLLVGEDCACPDGWGDAAGPLPEAERDGGSEPAPGPIVLRLLGAGRTPFMVST